jgi:preprotein translocase subunit SecA
MFKNVLKKVFGDPNEREVKRVSPIVEQINQLEPEFTRMDNEQLALQTGVFRAQIEDATLDLRQQVETAREVWLRESDATVQAQMKVELGRLQQELRAAESEVMERILPRAFAAVRESARRTIGLRPYDVQLIGGIVLHSGKIAEMKTGEGKTLVATLALYLNSLTGRGAHLVTPNDYLSKFGVQWMGPVYQRLGVSVSVIQSAAANPEMGSFIYDPEYPAADDRYQRLRPVSRRDAYAADITYGTNNEFGFDYLRDNMVQDLSQLVQRDLHYAIGTK